MSYKISLTGFFDILLIVFVALIILSTSVILGVAYHVSMFYSLDDRFGSDCALLILIIPPLSIPIIIYQIKKHLTVQRRLIYFLAGAMFLSSICTLLYMVSGIGEMHW